MVERSISEAERRIREAAEAGARELDVRWLDLAEVPLSADELQNVTRLVLSHNLLTRSPDWLSRLQGLRFLFISDNWLSELPSSLGGRLVGLQAGHNRLREVPASVT